MKKEIAVISLLFCIVTLKANAQNGEGVALDAFVMAEEGKIILRWAPNTPNLWDLGRKSGYQLERSTIVRNGTLLEEPERKILNQQLILPASEEVWSNQEFEDDYLAIAAQCLYGESMDIIYNTGSPAIQAYSRLRELETRFSYHLLACDMSTEAARLSGLFWEDKEVKANEKYIYRIYIPGIQADSGVVFVDAGERTQLSRIPDIKTIEKDRVVEISWDITFMSEYSGFYVFRADQSKGNFIKLNTTPMINMPDPQQRLGSRLSLIDTLASDIEHHYYVKGVNAFGILGPSSDTLSLSAGIVTVPQAALLPYTEQATGAVQLTWDFPADSEKHISHFELEDSENVNGPFRIRLKEIEKGNRNIEVSFSLGSRYIRLVTVDLQGNRLVSAVQFVNVVDSIAPEVPRDFKAYTDTLGNVYLTWRHNQEPDLAGYRVFRSFGTGEFTQLTVEPVEYNIWKDSVDLNRFNNKVYYQLFAVDQVDNYSDSLLVIEVELPDIVPPSPPVLKGLKQIDSGVQIEYMPSTSRDLAHHLLYRSAKNAPFELIAKLGEEEMKGIFIDSSPKEAGIYRFVLIAVDSSGNESEPTDIYSLTFQPKSIVAPVQYAQLEKGEKEVTLRWDYPNGVASKFHIYKKEGESFFLLKSVPGNIRQLKDTFSLSNPQPVYRIQAEDISGVNSTLSDNVL